MADDLDIQVVVFDSAVPDFFSNHFDLAAAADFPPQRGDDELRPWTDLVLKISEGALRDDRDHPRPHPRRRQRARPRARPSLRQPRARDLRAARGRQRPAARRRRHRTPPRAPSDATGRWRSCLPAPTTTPTRAQRWGWVTRALPDAELDAFVAAIVARLASFDRTSLAAAKKAINRATLPPDADLAAAYGEFAGSLTLPGFPQPARPAHEAATGPGRHRRRVPARGVHRPRQPAEVASRAAASPRPLTLSPTARKHHYQGCAARAWKNQPAHN